MLNRPTSSVFRTTFQNVQWVVDRASEPVPPGQPWRSLPQWQCRRGCGAGEAAARANPVPWPLPQSQWKRGLHVPSPSAAASAEAATEAAAQA